MYLFRYIFAQKHIFHFECKKVYFITFRSLFNRKLNELQVSLSGVVCPRSTLLERGK
jgi:hypothetical protein